MKCPGQRLGEMINHPQALYDRQERTWEDWNKLIRYFQCSYKDSGYPKILKGESTSIKKSHCSI